MLTPYRSASKTAIDAPTLRQPLPPAPRQTRVRPRPLPEVLLVAALFMAYKLGRIVADGHVARAYRNARSVWHVERLLRLPSEVDVQHALLGNDVLIRVANCYYAYVHFPATIAFLLYIYIRRPMHYLWLRRVMALVTTFALATHVLFPLAPPRMLVGVGLVDTAARYGPSVYGSPSTDTLSNQYAAMPSLHVGWALIVAMGLIVTARSRWRWLWLFYPATTYVVVLGTANHYWADGFVVIALVGVALLVFPRPASSHPVAAPRRFNRCAGRVSRRHGDVGVRRVDRGVGVDLRRRRLGHADRADVARTEGRLESRAGLGRVGVEPPRRERLGSQRHEPQPDPGQVPDQGGHDLPDEAAGTQAAATRPG